MKVALVVNEIQINEEVVVFPDTAPNTEQSDNGFEKSSQYDKTNIK